MANNGMVKNSDISLNILSTLSKIQEISTNKTSENVEDKHYLINEAIENLKERMSIPNLFHVGSISFSLIAISLSIITHNINSKNNKQDFLSEFYIGLNSLFIIGNLVAQYKSYYKHLYKLKKELKNNPLSDLPYVTHRENIYKQKLEEELNNLTSKSHLNRKDIIRKSEIEEGLENILFTGHIDQGELIKNKLNELIIKLIITQSKNTDINNNDHNLNKCQEHIIDIDKNLEHIIDIDDEVKNFVTPKPLLLTSNSTNNENRFISRLRKRIRMPQSFMRL